MLSVPEEIKIESNRRQHKIRLEEIQSAMQKANIELLAVEKDRRDAKATLDQHEEDVKVIKTIISEEKKKADDEIDTILSSFRNIEKEIFTRREEFNRSISVSP